MISKTTISPLLAHWRPYSFHYIIISVSSYDQECLWYTCCGNLHWTRLWFRHQGIHYVQATSDNRDGHNLDKNNNMVPGAITHIISYINSCTETEKSSEWLPWSSLGTSPMKTRTFILTTFPFVCDFFQCALKETMRFPRIPIVNIPKTNVIWTHLQPCFQQYFENTLHLRQHILCLW